MSFSAYSEYEDSGIECLGDIPIGWIPKRLKHTSPHITVGIVVNPSTYFAEEGLPFVHATNISEGEIEWKKAKKILQAASDLNPKTQLANGDLLTIRVGATRGVTAVVPPECVGGNCASVILVRAGEFDSRWLCYAMNSPVVQHQIEIVEYGAAQPCFNISDAVNFWLPVPEPREQKAISLFLDVETSNINGLVSEQRRLIELLKEKRQAVISHAVTKGLNPNARMKPSGIQWLGDVPEHWEVMKLGRVTLDRCDGPFGSGLKSSHYTDEGIRVIRLNNIRHDHFDDSDAAFIDPDHYNGELGGGHDVIAGDLLIAGLGDAKNAVGRACVAPEGIEPAMVKADCFRYRLDAERVLTSFMSAQLTIAAPTDAGLMSTGTTRSRMPLSVTSSRKVAFPAVAEQIEIANFIGERTEQFDALVAEAERAIELLQERRTALISAAVTGKIDVQECAYQETA